MILIGMNMLAAAFILISPQAGIMVLLAICVTLPMTFLVLYVVFEELTTEFLHESDPIHESKS
jgi:hypothetical protein